MGGGFSIVEYETVKQGFPEFRRVETAAFNTLLAKCNADWSPQTFGGMKPTGGQFGQGTIMPELFRDRATTTLHTWRQHFNQNFLGMTIPANNTLMTGSNGGNLYEDYKIGVCGLAFLDKAIKVTEIKMQISDRKLPRINLEEAFAYNKPAIVFEDFWILDEEQGFELLGYVTSEGYQTIKLLGPQFNRVPNKLMTTATGAALT